MYIYMYAQSNSALVGQNDKELNLKIKENNFILDIRSDMISQSKQGKW